MNFLVFSPHPVISPIISPLLPTPDGETLVNGARVYSSDYVYNLGVVHLISAVLAPSKLQLLHAAINTLPELPQIEVGVRRRQKSTI